MSTDQLQSAFRSCRNPTVLHERNLPMHISPALRDTLAPPVMQARRWLEGVNFSPEMPLLNLSQAAPVLPPPEELRAAMAEMLHDPATHLYGPVLGLPELRDALALRMSALYDGEVSGAQVAITSGCNQAFCAAVSSLASAGDNIILPVPWYFNHAMWLQMQGIAPLPLPCESNLLPDPDRAAHLITPRTRAIVLVTPNNPTGVEYPPELLCAFRDLAKRNNIALIVDETYRDFHSVSSAPHSLFTDPDWDDVLIHLYSFSKAYRLTGHRVGAIATCEARLRQIEKFLDTVAICPTGLGQRAALWGLSNLDGWLAQERAEILHRRAVLQSVFAQLPGWKLRGSGAYFGYVAHPFASGAEALARSLVTQAAILVLPGTMFGPPSYHDGAQHLRIAFANADSSGLEELTRRLAKLDR